MMDNKSIFKKYKSEYDVRENIITNILSRMSSRNLRLYKYSSLLTVLLNLPNNLLTLILFRMPTLMQLDFNQQYDIIIKWINERLFENEEKEDN